MYTLDHILEFIVRELEIYAGPSSMFKKYSYKETKKATNNLGTIIGQGGFGTVYKAQFSDGSTLAVKRMDKVSEQAVEEFCREIELLARLHHRHLVALKGFCIEKHERLLYIHRHLIYLLIIIDTTYEVFCLFEAGFSCMNIWQMGA